MAKLFGTNGIRGVFGQDITLEFIHDITLAIGTYYEEGPILVGYDGRDSSPLIAKTVCSVLNSIGIDCKITGLVPTPCLEFVTKHLGYRGGIMITASHNPPQYNGIKLAASDGVEISRDDELIIEEIYFQKNWKKNSSKYGTTTSEDSAIRVYLDGIKSQIDLNNIQAKNLKIVLDLGNGAQAVAAPILCEELGCKVITINETIDGQFPGRGSEPTPQNLDALSESVRNNSANLGIAFDGDGDRSVFCDNQGDILTGEKSALLFIQYLLTKNPGATIVTCLNSGSSIDSLATQTSSKVIRTKVGSVEVSRKMVPIDALIGFEENGGFMYGKHNQVRDGSMTMALALDLLASSSKTMTEHMDSIPPSFTTKDKISCTREESAQLIGSLKNQNSDIDTRDGIKITFDPKNWVMLRPSGTEPIVRIYAEGETQEKLDQIMSDYLKKIKQILSR